MRTPLATPLPKLGFARVIRSCASGRPGWNGAAEADHVWARQKEVEGIQARVGACL